MPKHKCPEGAPAWMTTMSDLNNLLLTFFVMLISMMTLEKPKLSRLTETLHQIGRRFKPTEGRTKNPSVGKIADDIKISEDQSSVTDVLDLNGRQLEVTKTISGVKYSFVSADLAFAEGHWVLNEAQISALNDLARLLYGLTNVIYIYGHCDVSKEDSIFVEGESLIPFSQNPSASDSNRGDKELLSILRATAIQKHISNPRRDNYIREDKIMPIGVSDKHPLVSKPATQEERGKNRRFEVLVTAEK